jgi:hypothetical protein
MGTTAAAAHVLTATARLAPAAAARPAFSVRAFTILQHTLLLGEFHRFWEVNRWVHDLWDKSGDDVMDGLPCFLFLLKWHSISFP